MAARTVVVQGGTAMATYRLHPLTPEQAEYHGCEGATHRLVGSHGETLGRWVETSGRRVRVAQSGWGGIHGVHGRFVVREDNRMFDGTGQIEDRVMVKGWAV